MSSDALTPVWLVYAFDVLLACVLVAVAWMCVTSARRIGAVLLFVCVGVLTALVWARLGAPDLALAEGMLGAGVTGVMFIAVWSQAPDVSLAAPGLVRRIAALGVAGIVVAIAGFALWPLMFTSASLAEAVAADIAATGVTHPVTAVLVDYRSFDTLLELGVLLAALMATWRLGLRRVVFVSRERGEIGLVYARIVAPGLVLVAGLLLWRGAFAPGGAFQAGTALAASGLLLLLVRERLRLPPRVVAVLATLGVIAFGLLGAGALVLTGQFLDWPDAHAGTFILIAEAGATLAIGVTLLALVIATSPYPDDRPSSGRADASTGGKRS